VEDINVGHADGMPAGLDGARDRVDSKTRTEVVRGVAAEIVALPRRRPNLLVAIDGASGTGKSTFADEVAEELATGGHQVVRASIDSFHRPRSGRYRRGTDSPEGYYLDSHDLDALQERLLMPFGTGAATYVTAVFDEPSDSVVAANDQPVPSRAILIFDGLFLHRRELIAHWDLTVFLIAEGRREMAWGAYLNRDLPKDETARRLEIAARVDRARRSRYVDGQALYEHECDPLRCANILIDNDDLRYPKVLSAGGRP
jgi:uridine kinase